MYIFRILIILLTIHVFIPRDIQVWSTPYTYAQEEDDEEEVDAEEISEQAQVDASEEGEDVEINEGQFAELSESALLEDPEFGGAVINQFELGAEKFDSKNLNQVRFEDPFSSKKYSPSEFANVIDTEVDADQSWHVQNLEALDSDPIRYKGQKASLINWEWINPNDWLNYDRWLSERAFKDKSPDWKIMLRDSDLKENIGKVLSCVGTCEIHRGSTKVLASYLSNIREADEFATLQNSYAYIFLKDGTLLRLAPKTSVSLIEMNVSNSKVFHYLRLNRGSILWYPRLPVKYSTQKLHETDTVFLPLKINEANNEWLIRRKYQALSEEEKIKTLVSPIDILNDRYQQLNKYIEQNSNLSFKNNELFLVTGNATLNVVNSVLDVFYESGNVTWFRDRDISETTTSMMEYDKDLLLGLRGYNNSKVQRFTEFVWHQVSLDGREVEEVDLSENQHILFLDFVTKRIPSYLVAREIMAKKYSQFVLDNELTTEIFAEFEGMRLWNSPNAEVGLLDDLEKRKAFLWEFTRRNETTNLRSLFKLLDYDELEGSLKIQNLDDSYYQKALDSYLQNMGNNYLEKNDGIKDYNQLMFYIWNLINSKGR
jgi:hypothetical protein